MSYGYKTKVDGSFTDAVEKTRRALAEEDFGILTEINVKETLKKKIDVNFTNYIILGACNPSFAHKALLAEKEIGLLLPCNVIVYEDDGDIYVSAILPSVAMGMVDNPTLAPISKEIEQRLKKVIDSLAS